MKKDFLEHYFMKDFDFSIPETLVELVIHTPLWLSYIHKYLC